jgi:YfiH family protein
MIEELRTGSMNQSINDNGNRPGPLTFGALSKVEGLVHGVFTRHGGVSQPPYASLNAAWNIGDSASNVAANLERIKSVLGIDRLVAAPQIHGDVVHVVDGDALESGEVRGPVTITLPGDALATDLQGVGLMIKIADCQAVFLVDPVRKVIANVHCGWRGSVNGILPKTVESMQRRFGCDPLDILAAISPSLGPCCAEFRNYRTELPSSFCSYQVKPTYFDFWAISRAQLTEVGLKSEHIEAAERCTVCESDRFFSYRAERATGRLAAVIAWSET